MTPLILISNDDGVAAPGLIALTKAVSHLGEVVVVAPETEQSAKSHSITLRHPLRHRRIDENIHAVDGTPADCVFIALYHPQILPRRPDIILSGINHGANLGVDVYYSGTVAAAREGAIRGIPSIAFSSLSPQQLERNATGASEITGRFLECEIPSGQTPLLNVNFPPNQSLGIRTTRLGKRRYTDEVTIKRDPWGQEYFWIGGPSVGHDKVEGSDTEAIEENYTSITPLRLEVTYPEHMGLTEYVAKKSNQEK